MSIHEHAKNPFAPWQRRRTTVPVCLHETACQRKERTILLHHNRTSTTQPAAAMGDAGSRREDVPSRFFDEMVCKGKALPCPHEAILATAWASPMIESEFCCRTGKAWDPFFHPRGNDQLLGPDLLFQQCANTLTPPGEELCHCRHPDSMVCHVARNRGPRARSLWSWCTWMA